MGNWTGGHAKAPSPQGDGAGNNRRDGSGLDDLEDFHGTCLGADAAGDALGSGLLGDLDQHMEGTYLGALAALGAELLVDGVNALGVLGDGAGFAGLGALAALDADHGLGGAVLLDNLDAGLIGMEVLVESVGAGLDASQAGHTFTTLFDCQLFHM